MGTINRQYAPRVKKVFRAPKQKLSKKEQALLNNNLSLIDKRNDALDALWYSFATSTSSTSTSTTTYGGMYTGTAASSTTGFYERTITGTRASDADRLEEEKKENAMLRDQLTEARRAKEIFTKVLTNLHVMIQELDLGDLRITDPFQYRVKRNELDETFNKILFYMEKHNPSDSDLLKTTTNERMLTYFEEKGLL